MRKLGVLVRCLIAIAFAAVPIRPIGAQNSAQSSGAASTPYRDPSLPVDRRVSDLVSRMTLEEKVLQMQHTAPSHPQARYSRLRVVERGAARRGAFRQCHGVSPSHRHGGHLGFRPHPPRRRNHCHRGSRQVQPGATRGQSQHPTSASTSGRRTSTSSATRAGAEDRRRSAKIPFSPRN